MYDWGDADQLVEYGSENSTSLWGSTFTLTPFDVNARGFGIAIQARRRVAGTNPIARIDFVSITVYYSAAIVVPVKLERLDAASEGNSVKLTWNVSEEANISAYIIERSTDGYNFQPIGSVNGENKKIYSFVDVIPSENNFYRLRMTDMDGKVKLSHIVSVKSKMSFQIKLSPNPVRNKLTVQHPKAEQKSRLQLLNNEGKLLADMAIPENAVITTLDLADMKSGIYYIKLKIKGDTYSQTVLKQ